MDNPTENIDLFIIGTKNGLCREMQVSYGINWATEALMTLLNPNHPPFDPNHLIVLLDLLRMLDPAGYRWIVIDILQKYRETGSPCFKSTALCAIAEHMYGGEPLNIEDLIGIGVRVFDPVSIESIVLRLVADGYHNKDHDLFVAFCMLLLDMDIDIDVVSLCHTNQYIVEHLLENLFYRKVYGPQKQAEIIWIVMTLLEKTHEWEKTLLFIYKTGPEVICSCGGCFCTWCVLTNDNFLYVDRDLLMFVISMIVPKISSTEDTPQLSKYVRAIRTSFHVSECGTFNGCPEKYDYYNWSKVLVGALLWTNKTSCVNPLNPLTVALSSMKSQEGTNLTAISKQLWKRISKFLPDMWSGVRSLNPGECDMTSEEIDSAIKAYGDAFNCMGPSFVKLYPSVSDMAKKALLACWLGPPSPVRL